eukprot:15366049-Ditylum_brightwellii.AAC.2
MLQFQGPYNGLSLLMISYRSERSSIFVTLYFINTLQDFTKESVLAHLPLYCNNFAAVLSSKATTAPGVKYHLCPDYDVVSKVWSQIKWVPYMNVSWVKAHQDDAKPMCELSLDAQLNYTANRDAELFRLNVPDHLSPLGASPELLLNHTYLVVNGTVVTNNLKSILQDNYEAINTRKCVKKKTSLDDATIDKIDWSALGQNLQRQHLFNQIRLVKFMHNWLHIGNQKNLMNATDLGVCLVCSSEHEKWTHLYHCKDAHSVVIRTLAIPKF